MGESSQLGFTTMIWVSEDDFRINLCFELKKHYITKDSQHLYLSETRLTIPNYNMLKYYGGILR